MVLITPTIKYGYGFNTKPNYDSLSLITVDYTGEVQLSINYIGDNNSGEIVSDWTDIAIINFKIIDSSSSVDFSWNRDRTSVEVYNPDGNFLAINGDLHNNDYLLTDKLIRPKPTIDSRWIRTGGPNGGIGYDIRIHPEDKNMMFVTDNPSGVNKSFDGGKTWEQRNQGISEEYDRFGNGAPIFSLSIDPGKPNIIWTGTQSKNGVYKSTDYGETWIQKIDGITEGSDISFRGFAVHPENSEIVLAAADISLGISARPGFELVRGKIYKTVDGGETWYPVWEGENCARILIYNYDNPDIVYCSTGIFDKTANNIDFDSVDPGGEGILKSLDGGETWFQINSGLENLYVGFIEMHPEDPNIIYAAAGGVTGQDPFRVNGGIYRTTNAGEQWEKLLEMGSALTVVTLAKSNLNVIYAGDGGQFYRSNDGGKTWYNPSIDQSSVWGPKGIWGGVPISAVVDPDNPEVIFVNSYQGGNYKSIDGAKTWINSSKGYSGANVKGIAVDPESPENVYAACFSGPFRSHNGGADWEGMKYGEAEVSGHWYNVTVNPTMPTQLLMSENNQGYILRSDNMGVDWEIAFKHPNVDAEDNANMHGFMTMEYALSDPDVIYAGMAKFNTGSSFDPNLEPSYGIFKSNDGGITWLEKNNGLESSELSISSMFIHPTNAKIVYAGTTLDGVYKSENGGDTWIRKSSGLGFTNVRALAVDPENPLILYAGSGEGMGLYKTIDGGETWLDMNDGINVICPSWYSPIGNTTAGITLNAPIPNLKSYTSDSYIPWTKINDIIIDPTNSKRVYIADQNSGIYITDDGGENWWLLNKGLPSLSVNCLDINNDGSVLYVGTEVSGVCRIVVGGNLPPKISQVNPINNDTIKIYQEDSVIFSIEAHDLNSDTIKYEWYLDGNLLKDKIIDNYQFVTDYSFLGPYHVEVTCSDNDSSITTSWSVQVLEKTLVNIDSDPNADNGCEIYPNPTEDYLNVKFSSNSSGTIEVFNSSGKLVNVKSFDNSISVTDIRINGAPGTYIVKVSTERFQLAKKLILTGH